MSLTYSGNIQGKDNGFGTEGRFRAVRRGGMGVGTVVFNERIGLAKVLLLLLYCGITIHCRYQTPSRSIYTTALLVSSYSVTGLMLFNLETDLKIPQYCTKSTTQKTKKNQTERYYYYYIYGNTTTRRFLSDVNYCAISDANYMHSSIL